VKGVDPVNALVLMRFDGARVFIHVHDFFLATRSIELVVMRLVGRISTRKVIEIGITVTF
jgi:rRNA processing protein Krr1/Pno1